MIGVFDSGLGGLEILKAFVKKLPRYDYIYLGDNARAPYGDKTQEEIYRYAKGALDFLFSRGCGLVIVACNTISANALRRLQREYLPKKYPGKRVLGIIIPVAEEAVGWPIKKIGVIGTRASINSKTFIKEIKKINPGLEIYQKSCPKLVPLIENGKANSQELSLILNKYLQSLKNKKVRGLIIGCTHYHCLSGRIARAMGKKVKIIDSPVIIADKLKNYLKRHPEIEKKLARNKKRLYFTTANPKNFIAGGKQFLGKRIQTCSRVKI